MKNMNKRSYLSLMSVSLAIMLLGMLVSVVRADHAGGVSANLSEISILPGGSGAPYLTAPDFHDPRSMAQKLNQPIGPVYRWKIEKMDGASPCRFIVLTPKEDAFQSLGRKASSIYYKHITLEAGRTTAGTSKVVISVTAHWKTAPGTGTVPDSKAYPLLTVPVKAGNMVLAVNRSLAKVRHKVILTAFLKGADLHKTKVTFHYRDSSGNDVAIPPKSMDYLAGTKVTLPGGNAPENGTMMDYTGIAQFTLPVQSHFTWPGNLVGKYRFWITTNEPKKLSPPSGGDGDSSGDPKTNEVDVTWGGVLLDIPNLPNYRKTNPGTHIVVNSNDSNGNGKPDTQDSSMSKNDPDLVPVKLKYFPRDLKSGTLTLSATAGSPNIRIWTDRKKSSPVTLPKTWRLSQVKKGMFPKTLYIEGVKASSSPRDTNLELSLTPSSGNSGSAIKDDVRITESSGVRVDDR